MKVEAEQDALTPASPGEKALSEMNAAFASCLEIVCPPIQYPPHCRFNPVRDAADTAEISARLEKFFFYAKQLEQLFLNDTISDFSSTSLDSTGTPVTSRSGKLQHQSDLELEIINLEAELAEKNDLIEKYTDVVRGWEGKFKRLDHRLSPDRE
ncbi:hypothetical protein CCR75_002894 [Bremia lactucae]|uniref:Uncharacterized protein n=1 Tax=Bremia lactucae TaxID=4779 RepID=A0A976IFR2_BRELC|nr:hypothetical protein CCR75_002894 [Bremia lactucae]